MFVHPAELFDKVRLFCEQLGLLDAAQRVVGRAVAAIVRLQSLTSQFPDRSLNGHVDQEVAASEHAECQRREQGLVDKEEGQDNQRDDRVTGNAYDLHDEAAAQAGDLLEDVLGQRRGVVLMEEQQVPRHVRPEQAHGQRMLQRVLKLEPHPDLHRGEAIADQDEDQGERTDGHQERRRLGEAEAAVNAAQDGG